jgi:DNA-binding NarL/FixJ family response regulator
MGSVTLVDSAVEIRGAAELRLRTAPIYATARTEMSCVAPDLRTWAVLHESSPAAPAVPSWVPRVPGGFTVRKLYGPAVLVDPRAEPLVRRLESFGATIRISMAALPETILIDRRVVITAGDPDERPRRYRVVTAPEVVGSVVALFDAAWRSAIDRSVYEASLTGLRDLAPSLLDALASGQKDEAAARALGMSLRTYRRRVAELMSAVGATSRFQAGLRARDLGLV